jgi:hypothetical protein
MMNLNKMDVNKTGQKALADIEKMIEYYDKAKGYRPATITLKAADYTHMANSFGKNKPEEITYMGVLLVSA